MTILFAPDSFKGTLSAIEVSKTLTEAAHEAFSDVKTISLPSADGGEGTVSAILSSGRGERVSVPVHGPLGGEKMASYARLSETEALMEMAEASGLTLISEEERNPLQTSTYGTGEMILHALSHGARHIYIGIGGSATSDGGMGAMEALGVRFLDEKGNSLPGCGASLAKVEKIDLTGLSPLAEEVEFTILSDVTNPLCGPKGAVPVFAPQKGADPSMVEILEKGMEHYRDILTETFGVNPDTIPGSGAAGGLGAALFLFLKGEMASGAEEVLRFSHFEEALKEADFVITGEGRTDSQSADGKIVSIIASHCQRAKVPCLIFSASLGGGWERLEGPGVKVKAAAKNDRDIRESMNHPKEFYKKAAIRLFQSMK